MKKIVTLIILLLGMLHGKHAQFLFDYHQHYDSIVALSQDKKGAYAYENLRERYEQADTSLTAFDMLALMVGETKQDHYYPYDLVFVEHEILRLANKGEFASALHKCDSLLAIHPLNFTAVLQKAFLEDQLGSLTAKASKFKFVLYLDVVLATGDGTYEAPIMVLSPSDGQLLIRYVFGAGIGSMGSGEDAHGYFLDMLEITKEGQEPTYMYFNIEHAVKRMFKEGVIKEFEKSYTKEQKKLEKEKKKAEKKASKDQ